jgi:quinol-cytochrome oxidoreductase complex cytochrome b subunit
MALVLFGLLLFTGVLMMFAYEPSPDRAWLSVNKLQTDTLFGELIRGVHYWSANLLIPISVLHLLRVFLTGAYHGRRRTNWHLGLGIIFFVLMSGFTGYLLPWDQTAYWAITICTEMLGQVPGIGPAMKGIVLGGTEIGPATMINFYALHVAVTPLAMLALLTWHFWHVRVAGGVVLPGIRPDDTRADMRAVPFSPDLLLRESVVAAVLIASVLVLAFFFAAPLGDPANPGISPNPAKAPWYFLGLQELLIHFDALFAVILIPICVFAGLVAVSFLPAEDRLQGDWFLTPKGRRMALVAALTALVAVPVFVLVDEYVIGPDGWFPGTASIISNGVVPFFLLVAGVVTYRMLVNKIFAPTRSEMIQTLFVLLFVAFAVLTATGVWFRGEGMSLVWPWQM